MCVNSQTVYANPIQTQINRVLTPQTFGMFGNKMSFPLSNLSYIAMHCHVGSPLSQQPEPTQL